MKVTNERKMRKLKEQGITLIALVVTIIILLILAGVTINLALGENGLISATKKAAQNYAESQNSEIAGLEKLTNTINNIYVIDENPGELDEENGALMIRSAEDFIAFSNNVTAGTSYEGKTVKLASDLDFASNASYVDPNSTEYAGYEGGIKKALDEKGFIPIGEMERANNVDVREAEYNYFKGTFDGEGHTISNLKINQNINSLEQTIELGLFTINLGTIKNLIIENANITANLESSLWRGVRHFGSRKCKWYN